jgi:hypothetical protein
MKLVTQRLLPHPPERVWSVLADFERYSEWNPLNLSARGQAELGARVPMTFINPGREGATVSQTVTVVSCEPPRRLAWRGHIPLLFTGIHFFELARSGDGTLLYHGEELSGLVPWTWSRERLAKQRASYELMNDALERRLVNVGRQD